jgi:hypothetical protein
MPARGIDELIWMAFTDSAFCERLLNGQRCEVLTTLSLTEAERQAVLAVKADTLETFAEALCRSGC